MSDEIPMTGTFLGVRTTIWFGIAKWLSIAGAATATLITALASAYHLLFH